MSAQPNEPRQCPGTTKRPPSAQDAGEPIIMVGRVPLAAKGTGALTVMVGPDPTIAKDARRRASP